MSNKTNFTQSGFTLIELMIVVAILSILAALAIPIYQTYIIKSQVTRVMGELGNLKSGVEQCILAGRIVGAVHSNAPAGSTVASGDCVLEATASTQLNGNAQGVGTPPTPGANGYPQIALSSVPATIVGTFGSSGSALISGQTITWSRSVDGTWTCSTTVPVRYRPSGC